jgi:hypothetical protein
VGTVSDYNTVFLKDSKGLMKGLFLRMNGSGKKQIAFKNFLFLKLSKTQTLGDLDR